MEYEMGPIEIGFHFIALTLHLGCKNNIQSIEET